MKETQDMKDILDILKKDSRYTPKQIATMLGKEEQEISDAIKKYDDEGIIVGYTTMGNWEKTNIESVTALIEVKVTPQRDEGFDTVAERIYKFAEVESCYLMSGGFDLTVIIRGKTLKEVALFVAEKLSTLDSVLSTSTHFVLKKYKENDEIFEGPENDDREAMIL